MCQALFDFLNPKLDLTSKIVAKELFEKGKNFSLILREEVLEKSGNFSYQSQNEALAKEFLKMARDKLDHWKEEMAKRMTKIE